MSTFDKVRSLFLKLNQKGNSGNGVLDKESTAFDITNRVFYIQPNENGFSSMSNEDKKILWGTDVMARVALSQILDETRFAPILEDIRSRFAGKQIGIRGVLSTLGETSTGGVNTLSTTMTQGAEKVNDNGTVLLVPIGDASNLEATLPDKVSGFMIGAARDYLVGADENFQSLVVPTVLVYDLSENSGVDKIDGKVFDYQLPDDTSQRAKCVIGAYPVDVRNLLPAIE